MDKPIEEAFADRATYLDALRKWNVGSAFDCNQSVVEKLLFGNLHLWRGRMNWKRIICAWRGHNRGKPFGSTSGLLQCPFCKDTWAKNDRPKSLIERVRRGK